jgi:DeoR/GlpR family transcriptional regulator of sugar metabolism
MTSSNHTRLLAEGRRRKILELVDQTGQVTVHDVVKRFAVSAVTARSDLDALSSNGVLLRSHGGAVRYEPTQDYPLKVKATIHRSEKARIGQAAAQLVKPSETIILDSGTTTAEIAKALIRAKLKSLTVVTNALNIANELADAQEISLIMILFFCRSAGRSYAPRSARPSTVFGGGWIRPHKWTFYGRRARGATQWANDGSLKRSYSRSRFDEARTSQSFPDWAN